MKTIINSFYIDGYRNLSKVNLSLNNITAIIALNNYGKSNLINAIRMGIDFIKGNSETKNDIFGYQPAFPFVKINAGRDFTFGIKAEMLENNGDSYKIDYRYSFSWKSRNSSGKIVDEVLSISSEKIEGGKFIIRQGDTGYLFRSSIKSRNKRDLLINDNSLAINVLVNLINGDEIYLEILKELNDLKFSIEDHFDANESFDFDPIQYKGVDNLNIPRIIWNIKNDEPSQYKLLMDGFKQLFPNITDVHCHEHKVTHGNNNLSHIDQQFLFNDSIYTLSVTDPTLIRPISFNSLSDGTKRVFLTLTTAVEANINHLSVLALEEPENSIHPKLLQSYISILDSLSGDCKLLFTSHSPYIIQFTDPNNIILGLPSATGLADFRYIKRSRKLIEDAANNGCSIGDYIFSSLSFDNAAEMLSDYVTDSFLEDKNINSEE